MEDTTDTRLRQRSWQARRSHTSANIGRIPPPLLPRRREACGDSLRLFLETYFPGAFPLDWSADHIEMIEKTEAAVLRGGQFIIAMPRGSGKTSIHLRSAMWAINYGLTHYVYIVCADAQKAINALKSIKTEYEWNTALYQDFPEICKPIRELQGASQAAKKQHIDGVPTLIDWTNGKAQLPYVDGSLASGAMIGVGGLTAASRGAQITLPDGTVKRPTVLLVDDFQTRESAASPTQCKTRLDTMTGDLLGMRGPSDPMSVLATGTVIYRGDAADQLLDRKRFPEWHGTRKKLVYSWPTDEKLWEQYTELRKQALREDREPTEATEYYAANRAAMDAGAVVAWPERKLADEISALQHAFNLRIADPDAFEAEYQNEPVDHAADDVNFLTADLISDKLNNLPKGTLPADVNHITAAIDVQGNSLWWIVTAWAEGFTGYVCDYDVFPKQGRRLFEQRKLTKTFATHYRGLSEEEAIYRSLGDLTGELCERTWTLANGAKVGISRILIDEGYRDKTVHLFCETAKHRLIVMPAKGHGIKAGAIGMNEWAPKKPELVGWNWRMRLGSNSRTMRHILWDSNFWKTFIQERLVVGMGGRGCLSLWGNQSMEHRQLAQHLTSETPTRTAGKGRSLVEWEHKPAKPDNHWLDALAMSAVAASERGITLLGQAPVARKKSKGFSLL